MPAIATTSLADSYRLCREAARKSASNFYWSFWLLDGPKRRAMCALYAFARRVDDLGDDGHATSTERKLRLTQCRRELFEALAGNSTDPLFPALVDAIRRFEIPIEHLLALIDGVERDLSGDVFATRDELLVYFHQVASAVGLACLHVWTDQPRDAYEPARDCGVAFQWTNVLRDLREDAERGRVYFANDELQRFGVSRADILECRASRELENLLRHQVACAEEYYARGRATRDYLQRGARRSFDLMFRTYHQLLDDLRRQPLVALRRRVRLNPGKKLWIAATTCLGSPPPLCTAPTCTSAVP